VDRKQALKSTIVEIIFHFQIANEQNK
jgi:hypothetical protein